MIPKGPRKQNQYGFYYDDCGCLECQYVRGQIFIAPQGEALPHQWEGYYAGLRAQDNANRSPAESKNDAPTVPGIEEFKTVSGRVARVQTDFRWNRKEFAYLGTVEMSDGRRIGWAWHDDGTSIDKEDPAFSLTGFLTAGQVPLSWTTAIARMWSRTDAPYALWLGKEGCA